MNQKIRDFLVDQYTTEQEKKEGFDLSDPDILDCLESEDKLVEYELCKFCWWAIYERVVKVGDKFIAFELARTTGDDSPEDKGYKPNFFFFEVEPYETTVTKYRVKK